MVKRGEIQQQLAATNRWWNDERWARDDPDLRQASEAPFRYASGILGDLTEGGLYVLRGPRRVGKSVETKLTIKRMVSSGVPPRRIVHMSVDGWNAADLGRLVGAVRHMTPPDEARYWFIDEITGIADGWAERVKWLRDNDPRFRTDTVVLTGSSSSGLRDSVGILAGRRGRVADPDLVLLPMGFRTFARLTAHRRLPDEVGTERIIDLSPSRLAEAVYEMVPWLDLLVDAWEAYLHVGGFPAAVSDYITALTSGPGLESELLRVITGDAFRRARMADVQTHVMLRRLVGGLCSPLNVARLAREVGVPQPTAQRRVDDLREAFVIWPVHRELGEMPALRSQRKYYFTDPIYTRLVTGAAPDLTALSEQQLGMALLRNLLRRYPGAYPTFDRVLYHRSGTGAEIDYVGRDFGGVAIESKYVDGGWRRSAGRTLAASRWRGVVATRSEIDLEDPGLCAVPTALLAWLLDT